MKTLTIFTPTYNRAYCLERLYESLKKQTCMDFEWMIIDDGSSDETSKLVESWQNEKPPFTIWYFFKENGGMHTAYNLAYEKIFTELSMNVDSDDFLPPEAVERILAFWQENKAEDVGGIYALDQDLDGHVIGTPFPEDLKEFTGWGYRIIYYEAAGKKKKYKNQGDKKFIGVTKYIQKYPPIPVFEGEKYRSLYWKQHLIERDARILILNQQICTVEYQADGSSATMWNQYLRNPRGFCDERKYVMIHSPSFWMRLKEAMHYVAESKIAKEKNYISGSPRPGLTVLALPVGLLLYRIILRKARV